jgi:hypothetical protein
MIFTREWAMPNKETFSVKPIGSFVMKYLRMSNRSVDPFAGNFSWPTVTNDLNVATMAQYHMDAVEFLILMQSKGEKFDLLILDPPYSPRQISECYRAAGKTVGMKDTQSGALYAEVKKAANQILEKKCRVLSFGWSTVGMGKMYGFKIEEIMLVCHGGAHNDTICLSETRE